MQVINDPNRQSFGESAVNSLSSVLQGLAQNKVQQIQKANAVRELQSAFPDLDQGSLAFLASQPAKQQLEYLQNYSSGLQNLQQQQQEQQMAQAQQLQGLSEQQQQPSIPYAPGFKGPKQANYGGLEQQQRDQQIQQLQQDLVKPQKKLSLGQGLAQSDGFGKNALAREKFEAAKAEKAQKEINKSNAPFVKAIEADKKTAASMLKLVNEMLDLETKGETPENRLTRGLGAYLPGVLNPYNVYNAKSNDLAAIKSAATGRPSVFMTQLQQSTKPNTSMSKSERLELLNSLKANATALLGVEEAAREIIEENGGKEPRNLENLAEDRFFERVLPDPADASKNAVIEGYGRRFRRDPNEARWIKLKIGVEK